MVPFLWGFYILECDSPFFCDEDASGIVAPSSLRFTKNEFGKPNVRALSLSLSLALSRFLIFYFALSFNVDCTPEYGSQFW